MTRRVVISGIGIVSSIGNSQHEVLDSLRTNRSGLETMHDWAEYDFKSLVAGTIKQPGIDVLREKFSAKGRFMGLASLYAMLCAEEAIADSGLRDSNLQNEKTGCIAGSSYCSSSPYIESGNRLAGRPNNVGPFEMTRGLVNSIPANFSSYYGLKGRCYSIGSACATSVHNVGHAFELVKSGLCDTVLAGGAEEPSAELACMFEGMGRVTSKRYNNNPTSASRAFDKDRDGFVISGGAGIVIVEEYEQAIRRNAPIYGEILGFGTSADGYDIIKPDPTGDGCFRCMEIALRQAHCMPTDIDYVNAHGTSTPKGDIVEAQSIARMFGQHKVPVSSTKSLTGHGIGASGVQELIYCLLMMKNSFVVASANIDNLGDEFKNLNILLKNEERTVNTALTNSFGFGGTNGSLLVAKCQNS